MRVNRSQRTVLVGKGETHLRHFVLASVASLKGESDADSHTVALISAGVRLQPSHGFVLSPS
jgi:hypothetical protein